MNLSRYIYFEAFVKCILNNARKLIRDRNKIIDEINYQTQKIYNKQKDGYWPVTDGDNVFIHFLNCLKACVQDHNEKKALNELLSSARDQAEVRLKIVFLHKKHLSGRLLKAFMRNVYMIRGSSLK